MTLTCTYDKTTFLIRDCRNAVITETILGYDDPANAVDLPAEVSGAVDAGPIVVPVWPTQKP